MLASRNYLCVNTDINQNKDLSLNAACSSCVKAKKCKFKENNEESHRKLSWEPYDIEDLYKQGREKTFCPYYMMKQRVKGADVIFMPYVYLIDDAFRD